MAEICYIQGYVIPKYAMSATHKKITWQIYISMNVSESMQIKKIECIIN